MATKPTIDIEFKQLATSLIQRSERGTAILLLKEKTASTNTYKLVSDIDESLYTSKNLSAIKSCMAYAPYEVIVIAQNSDSFSAFAPEILKANNTGWIGTPIGIAESKLLTKTYNPTTDTNELDLTYTNTGLWANSKNVSFEYEGATYTKALKIQSNCEIKFNLPKSGTATLLVYKEGAMASSQILVDGLAVPTPDDKNILSLNLSQGEHTITRGANDAHLFAIMFSYYENEMQSDLASWIKAQENMGRTYKGIGTSPNRDCKHYVYFNQNGKDTNDTDISAVDYIPSLLGILASCNISKGCTNFLCSDLSYIDEVEDIDTAVANGQLVLTNDLGGVRIVTGCNSLVSLNGNTATEDMQYIETVEAMDLIRDDIRTVFKTTYQGKFRNKYKYQMLFIGAVNQYYSQLANEDILDDEFDNKAEIDVDEQRSAWVGTGKSEAQDWDDDKVRRMAFKRSVFVKSNIKVLGSMENLKFTVTLE